MSNSGLFYVSGARRLQERRFTTVYVGAVHAPVAWWATCFCRVRHETSPPLPYLVAAAAACEQPKRSEGE